MEKIYHKSFLEFKESNENILNDLIPLINSFRNKKLQQQTFVEPFLGTGCVFLNVEGFENFILNDLNVNIFMLFHQVKNNQKSLLEDVNNLFYLDNKHKQQSEERIFFNEKLIQYNKFKSYYEMCQLFVYLNKHSTQGSMSLNNHKIFSKRFSKHKKPHLPKIEMDLMHKKLNENKVQIFNHSFERVFENLEYGDVVYCDPPDINSTNKSFDYKKHELLTKYAVTSSLKGSRTIISNTYNEVTKELYKDCSEYYIKRFNTNRKKIREEIIAIYA